MLGGVVVITPIDLERAVPSDPASANTRLVLGPNASLSVTQAIWVFVLMAAVTLAIAIGFALLGFWPMLPFAGLEVAALGAALWVGVGGNRYREVLGFDAGRLRIWFGKAGGSGVASIDWPRAWTKVELAAGATSLAPSVLKIHCYGQSVTLGRCLSDAERQQVFQRIKQLLPPVWRTAWAEEPDNHPAASISTGE